jgi:hypothetical protein
VIPLASAWHAFIAHPHSWLVIGAFAVGFWTWRSSPTR